MRTLQEQCCEGQQPQADPSRAEHRGGAADGSRPGRFQILRAQFEAQRRAFRQAEEPDYTARRAALDALLQGILGRKEELAQALDEDFGGRAHEETYLLDMFSLVEDGSGHHHHHFGNFVR
jgi:acyl-CoA reductase-like NAD-dependent aldehyde dehydrogenase